MDGEFKAIETQEAFDAAIKERLARERKKILADYADYDEMKSKATKADEQLQASTAELEKANARIKELENDANATKAANEAFKVKQAIAKETGVPSELIVGDTEEDMRTFAASIAKFAKRPSAPTLKETGTFAEGESTDSDLRSFVSSLIPKNN